MEMEIGLLLSRYIICNDHNAIRDQRRPYENQCRECNWFV